MRFFQKNQTSNLKAASSKTTSHKAVLSNDNIFTSTSFNYKLIFCKQKTNIYAEKVTDLFTTDEYPGAKSSLTWCRNTLAYLPTSGRWK